MEVLMIRRDGTTAIHLTQRSSLWSLVFPSCGADGWDWQPIDAPIDADLCAACLYRLRLAEAQGARR